MPELPEVERVRLSLLDHLIGRRVTAVTVRRAEIVEAVTGSDRPIEEALLAHRTIERIDRRGKQLAIVAEDGATMCVHLGMTGSLTFERTEKDASGVVTRSSAKPGERKSEARKHTHLIWRLASAGGSPAGTLSFDDPRRFGGVWTFASFDDLLTRRWSALGEDALRIKPVELHEHLRRTSRGLKAALLDQQVIAGLGNIYVDELLFEMGLHPARRASRLTMNDVQRMVPMMRRLLRRAIASGGSSLRDYVDGNGSKGAYQLRHQVYGRGGKACRVCESKLRSRVVAGRTTVWCSTCQKSR